jgi:hypothetical protein
MGYTSCLIDADISSVKYGVYYRYKVCGMPYLSAKICDERDEDILDMRSSRGVVQKAAHLCSLQSMVVAPRSSQFGLTTCLSYQSITAQAKAR